MAEQQQRPLPAADELTRPFWEAARQHQLVIQQCSVCDYFNHPPRTVCDACQSQTLAFVPVSGKGSIYTFSVMYQQNIAGFEQQVPYVNLLVELDEQPQLFMVTNLPGAERERVKIGGRVEVYFEDVNEEISLPLFRVVAA